jgi:hypothetical protein
MAADPIGLRAGDEVLRLPASGEVRAGQVAALVEAANRTAHIEGLPDALNPDLLDQAKAIRLAAGLAMQPPAILQRLADHDLWLNWERLGLSTVAPTRPEAFAAGFELVIDDIQGRHVLAHTTVPIDPGLAQSRCMEAQRALAAVQTEVQRLEAAGAGGSPDVLGLARLRRSAIARTWRIEARAWATARPQDPAAKSASTEAERAAEMYVMPSGGISG